MILFAAQTELKKLAVKAADLWNRALRCEVLRAASVQKSDCIIRIIHFCDVVRSRDPTRIAEHRGGGGQLHVITLAHDVRWQVTPWQRFWGLGDADALAALLHEFGHALGLPHSDRDSDVMSPVLGSTVISDDEAARYRRFLNL